MESLRGDDMLKMIDTLQIRLAVHKLAIETAIEALDESMSHMISLSPADHSEYRDLRTYLNTENEYEQYLTELKLHMEQKPIERRRWWHWCDTRG